ncbi:MAG: helix-turn-helix domain-containing protein [Sulfurospirillum sp.]|nr:helix-turn-helix domain-containing protein [Sulfurospirillum sp.]
MSKTDLAEVLKVSLSTINRRLKNGKLPPHANIGDRVLFPTEGVAVFLTQMGGCQLEVVGGEL